MMATAERDSYDAFADYYDLYWSAGYLRHVEAGLEEILLPLVAPGSRVLDLCCGTGRLAGWLCERGFDVVGLDASGPMLEVARRNAPQAEFIAGDARSFHLRKRADLAISTFDSINHFATLNELEDVFRSVRAALADDGLLCFDLNSEEGFEYAAGETYAAVDDDHVCISKSAYNTDAGVGVSTLTVFERADELWRRTDAEVREYLHPPHEVEERLARAGFDQPRIFDAEDDFAMPHGQGRLFFVTRPI